MTQTPFERYDPKGNIDPVEQVDYTEAIEQNQANLQQELEKHNRNLFQIEMAAARGKDNALMQLAQLSPAAAQLAKPYAEAYNTRKEVEAAKIARKYYSNNPDFYELNFNPKEAVEDQQQTWHEDKVDTDVRNGLLTPDQGKEFRDLSKGMQNRVRRSLLVERAKAYPGFVLHGKTLKWPIVTKDGKQEDRAYDDPKNSDYERNQIMGRINNAYLRDFSNDQWDQAQVWKYLGAPMESHEASLDTALQAEKREDYENLVESRTQSDVIAAIKDGGPGVQNWLVQTAAGKYAWAGAGGMKLARLELDKHVTNIAQDERYNDHEQLKKAFFGDELEFNDGNINTLGGRFPQEFAGLERVFANAEQAEIQEIRLKDKNRTNEFEASFIKMRADKENSTTEDNELTESDIKGVTAQFRKEFPGREIPDFIKNYVTAEDREDKEDMELLGAIFRDQGVIYHTDMAGMSHNVQASAEKQFGDRILGDNKGDLISKYASIEGEVGKQIDAQVNEFFNATAGDTKDTEAMVVAKQEAKADFQRIFWKNYLGDENTTGLPFDQARTAALTEIRKNLQAGKYKLDVVPENPKANFLRKRKKAKVINKENPQSYKTDLLPHTNPDILTLRKVQAGVPNATIPDIYHYYAELNPQLNLDAFDVANAQLKLYEQQNNLPVKGLDQSKSITKQYLEGLTSPIEQRFLKSRPSYGRNNRVMVLQGGGNFNDPELVIDEAL